MVCLITCGWKAPRRGPLACPLVFNHTGPARSALVGDGSDPPQSCKCWGSQGGTLRGRRGSLPGRRVAPAPTAVHQLEACRQRASSASLQCAGCAAQPAGPGRNRRRSVGVVVNVSLAQGPVEALTQPGLRSRMKHPVGLANSGSRLARLVTVLARRRRRPGPAMSA